MSLRARRAVKFFVKALGLAVAGYSAYILYNLLTVPWTYPILNTVSMILLIAVIVLGVLSALW